MESILKEYNSPRKLLRIDTTMGVRGQWNSRCRSVDRPIAFLHEFAYSVCSLDSRKTTQLRNLEVFDANTWQNLPHLLLEV